MKLLRRREWVTDMRGLTEAEHEVLSTYNSECARGLVHTEEWRTMMRELQRRYDDARQAGDT